MRVELFVCRRLVRECLVTGRRWYESGRSVRVRRVSDERSRVQIINELMVVNFVKAAICDGCS